MHALHAYARGDPSRLVYEEAGVPVLAADDVLVRVHASGVTPSELDRPCAWFHHDGIPRTPPVVPRHEIAGLLTGGHLRSIVSTTLPLAREHEACGPNGHRGGPGKTVLLVAGSAKSSSAQALQSAVTGATTGAGGSK